MFPRKAKITKKEIIAMTYDKAICFQQLWIGMQLLVTKKGKILEEDMLFMIFFVEV